MRIVAVDIGGTMIKSGLWNGETFVELRETETRASEGGAALMERVKGLIHSYHDFEAIGISTAGEVNTEDGSIFYANSNIPGYTGMPVKQIMEEEFVCLPQWRMTSMRRLLANSVQEQALDAMIFMSDLWNRCRRKHCDERKRLPRGFFFCRKLWRNGDPSGRKGGTDSLEGCYERCASTTGLVRRVKKVDGSLDNGKKYLRQRTDRRSKSRLMRGSTISAQVL